MNWYFIRHLYFTRIYTHTLLLLKNARRFCTLFTFALFTHNPTVNELCYYYYYYYLHAWPATKGSYKTSSFLIYRPLNLPRPSHAIIVKPTCTCTHRNLAYQLLYRASHRVCHHFTRSSRRPRKPSRLAANENEPRATHINVRPYRTQHHLSALIQKTHLHSASK